MSVAFLVGIGTVCLTLNFPDSLVLEVLSIE